MALQMGSQRSVWLGGALLLLLVAWEPAAAEPERVLATAWDLYRWYILAVLVLLVLKGAMIAWLLIERHSRRKAELESRQHALEVMHLSAAAEAGALSASFAHELGQPLAGIMLNAEAAKALVGTNPPQIDRLKEALSDIEQAGRHATQIIRHMRSLLKRRPEVELQEFNLNEVIVAAVNILAPEAARRNVSLLTNYIEQPLIVRADRVHLEQVILSLTTNALDAMEDTELKARRIIIDTVMAADSQVEVAVSDTGPGIPPAKLSEIFGTFYTTKRHGTGLGLTIARTIVENYGGKIWANNRAEGGAVFRFSLPIFSRSTPRASL